MEKKSITKSEFAEWIRIWWSKYSNCDSRFERELYLKAYTSLKDIYDLWVKENRFVEEGDCKTKVG